MLTERSQVSPRTVWTVGLHTTALALGVAGLYAARTVLGWMMLAALVALALEPVVRLAERRGLRHTPAVLLVWTLLTLLGLGLLWMLVPLLVEQVQALAHAAPRLVEEARHLPWLQRYLGDETRSLGTTLAGHARDLAAPAFKVLKATLGVVLEGITIYFLALFMLLFGRDLSASVMGWVAPDRREHWRALSATMQQAVSGYTLGTLAVSAVTGAVAALILLVADVPYFLALGLLVGVLEIIPFIGMTIATVIILGLVVATKDLATAAVVEAVLFTFLQLKNHVLNPLVQRKTIDMNPLLITTVLLVGTATSGIVGTLLALPLAAAAQVLLRAMRRERAERWGELEAPAEEEVARGARDEHRPQAH